MVLCHAALHMCHAALHESHFVFLNIQKHASLNHCHVPNLPHPVDCNWLNLYKTHWSWPVSDDVHSHLLRNAWYRSVHIGHRWRCFYVLFIILIGGGGGCGDTGKFQPGACCAWLNAPYYKPIWKTRLWQINFFVVICTKLDMFICTAAIYF